jgi:hypothetical protein
VLEGVAGGGLGVVAEPGRADEEDGGGALDHGITRSSR